MNWICTVFRTSECKDVVDLIPDEWGGAGWGGVVQRGDSISLSLQRWLFVQTGVSLQVDRGAENNHERQVIINLNK